MTKLFVQITSFPREVMLIFLTCCGMFFRHNTENSVFRMHVANFVKTFNEGKPNNREWLYYASRNEDSDKLGTKRTNHWQMCINQCLKYMEMFDTLVDIWLTQWFINLVMAFVTIRWRITSTPMNRYHLLKALNDPRPTDVCWGVVKVIYCLGLLG